MQSEQTNSNTERTLQTIRSSSFCCQTAAHHVIRLAAAVFPSRANMLLPAKLQVLDRLLRVYCSRSLQPPVFQPVRPLHGFISRLAS